MEETKKTTTTTTTTTTTKRPEWWTEHNDTSWAKARTAVIEDWGKMKEDAQKLGDHISDKALSFGHEAQAKFAGFATWNEEFQKKLAEDWKKTEESASEGWSQVSNAVKHGWERAKASVKSS